MQELQVIDDKKINKIYEMITTLTLKTYYQRQLTHGIVMLSQLLTHLQP